MDSQPVPLDASDNNGASGAGQPLSGGRAGAMPPAGQGADGRNAGARAAEVGGDPALAEPVDRRSAPRRPMPLGPAFHADLVILGRSLSLSLEDLSLGGVALRASKAEAGGLLVGRRLPQVRLSLGDHGVMLVSLEVRARRSFRSFLAGEQVHVGCRFVDLDTAGQARLQAIIEQLHNAFD
jgi:PilZ domain